MKFEVISVEFKIPFALRIPDETFVVNLGTPQLCHIRVKTELGRTEFLTEDALGQNLVWENYGGPSARLELETATGKKVYGLETIFNEDASLLGYRIPVGYTSVDILANSRGQNGSGVQRGSRKRR